MSEKRLLFIYNPNAGKGVIPKHLDEVTEVFEKAGYDVGLYRTRGQRDGTQKVEYYSAYKFDRIVCSGGDGTLSEVVSGMMALPRKDRLPVGFIPAGSTNDTGKSYGLPESIREAAEIAATGQFFSTDIGHFNDEFFTYVASFGRLSAVSCFTPQDIKRRWGYLAYLWEGLKVLLHLDAYDLKVEYVDEEEKDHQIEANFFLGMITNSLSVGGFAGITGDNVDLQDGLFEVTLCKRPRKLGEFRGLINDLLLAQNKEWNNGMVTRFKASRIHLTFKDDVQWVLDGENAGKHKDISIFNDSRALDIIVKK